jgi:hypothetical protein
MLKPCAIAVDQRTSSHSVPSSFLQTWMSSGCMNQPCSFWSNLLAQPPSPAAQNWPGSGSTSHAASPLQQHQCQAAQGQHATLWKAPESSSSMRCFARLWCQIRRPTAQHMRWIVRIFRCMVCRQKFAMQGLRFLPQVKHVSAIAGPTRICRTLAECTSRNWATRQGDRQAHIRQRSG